MRNMLIESTMLIGLTVGCSPSFNAKDGMVDTTTFDPSAEGGWESATGLSSLKEDMDTDYCENMQPNVAGATSYFYGIYQKSSDGWQGEEQWILHPTEAWTSTGGETCYVTWAISADEKDAAGCPSCNFSLEVNGTLDRQKTDCPEGLWENEEQWSTTYNILVEGGNSMVYFQSDGDTVGSGYSTSNAFNFLSDVSCSWF